MAAPDFYALLGVNRNAGLGDIKRAYRRLAVTWHPDKNPGSRLAEERFKALAEAYAVLSNPQKRQQYDLMGPEDFRHEFSQEDVFKGFDPGDLFAFFGQEEAKSAIDHIFKKVEKKERGADPRISDFFAGFGQKSLPGQGHRRSPGILLPLAITLREAVFGATRTVAYNGPQGVVKLPVEIPAGSQDGRKITIKAKGPGLPGAAAGDVLVTLTVLPDPDFTLEGHNLVTAVFISRHDLECGAKPLVKTLDGRSLRLYVSPETKAGARLKISGHGAVKADGTRGDLLVRVTISI